MLIYNYIKNNIKNIGIKLKDLKLFEGINLVAIYLITNEPRTASIVAKTKLVTLKINKELLDMIIKNFENWEEIKEVIMKRIMENMWK